MLQSRKGDHNRGSVLVELTMVLLPLMLIVMGMVEIGGAWRDKSTAIQASRQGARVAVTSSIATTDTADKDALRALLAGFPSGISGGSTIELRKVIIYDAAPATAATTLAACQNIGEAGMTAMDMPAGVTNAHGSRCNIYLRGNAATSSASRASLELVDINGQSPNPDYFDGTTSAWNSSFPASQRNNTLGSSGYIGVYVEAFRPWITGFFPGDGIIISGETVMRIEPPPP